MQSFLGVGVVFSPPFLVKTCLFLALFGHGCHSGVPLEGPKIGPAEIEAKASNAGDSESKPRSSTVAQPQRKRIGQVDPPDGSLFSSRIRIRPNPIRRAPLAAIVEFSTHKPARVRIRVSDGRNEWEQDWSVQATKDHAVVVLGLRPFRRHKIQMLVTDVETETEEVSEPLLFDTPRLPSDFPPIRTKVSQPEKMEPGVTFFAVNIWRDSTGLLDYGYILALDSQGEVVWYCHTQDRIADLRRTSRGTLLYQHGNYRYAYEIDLLGRDLKRWIATNLTVAPDMRSVSVPIDTTHHDLFETPHGTMMTLATTIEEFDKYPTSETDPTAPWEPANVVCDQIVEFNPATGSIVDQMQLVDVLDRRRFGYMALTGFWNDKYRDKLGGPARDWSHANSLVYMPDEKAVIVSFRHLDCLMKIGWPDKKIRWILGDPDGWDVAWRHLLLRPKGELQWPYHQHSPQLTPRGTLLLYDNGNFRARPYDSKTPGEENRSRVVEYRIDEQDRTVTQVSSYDGGGLDPFYCPFYCEADWLPMTSNLLVTDGGHIELDDSTPSDTVPSEHQWARILEVTQTEPREKVFEVIVRSPPQTQLGWSIYRANRWNSLYEGFQLRVPEPTDRGALFPRLPHQNREFPKVAD